MKFKWRKLDNPVGGSDGDWYMLTDGGYVSPDMLLEDEEQARKVQAAIDLVFDFIEGAKNAGLWEEW